MVREATQLYCAVLSFLVNDQSHCKTMWGDSRQSQGQGKALTNSPHTRRYSRCAPTIKTIRASTFGIVLLHSHCFADLCLIRFFVTPWIVELRVAFEFGSTGGCVESISDLTCVVPLNRSFYISAQNSLWRPILKIRSFSSLVLDIFVNYFAIGVEQIEYNLEAGAHNEQWSSEEWRQEVCFEI